MSHYFLQTLHQRNKEKRQKNVLINYYDSPSTLFPLGSGCDISESLYNTWYCFDRNKYGYKKLEELVVSENFGNGGHSKNNDIVNVEESELSCSYAQKTGNLMILDHQESSFQKVLKTLKILRESDQCWCGM